MAGFTYTLTSSNGFAHSNGAYVARLLVDSAEDGDLAEYTDNTGEWVAADYGADAYDGDWVLLYDTDGGIGANGSVISLPGDGLPRYPDRGQTLGTFTKLGNWESWSGIQFFCQEDRNTFPKGYSLWVEGDNDLLRLTYQDPANDVTERLASTSVDVSDYGTDWLQLEVDAEEPTLTGRLRVAGGQTLAEISDDDSRLDDGGISVAAERRVGSSISGKVHHDLIYLIE